LPFSPIPTLSDEVVALLLVGGQESLDDLETSVLRIFADALIDRASTSSGARSWMARGGYHMIMCAAELPDGDGIALLEEAHQSHRNAVRVLLGDGLSSETAAAAINSGQVYRILSPPYTDSVVERCVRNGLDWRQHGLAMRLLLDDQREVHLALASSLSALERTQRQMVHVERLATVGRLTSGIIHEVRNQLTGLMGVFDTIRYEGGPSTETAKRGYEVVKRLVARISSIESFARGGGWAYEMEDVSAGEVLDQLHALYRLEVGEPGLLVAAKPEVRDALFHVDAGKLVHVILALAQEGHDRFNAPINLRATLRSDDALQIVLQASASSPRPRVRRPDEGASPLRTVVQMIVEAHGGRLVDLDPDARREYVRITVPCAAIRRVDQPPTQSGPEGAS
jgi:signal transduction histidine kinase